MTRWDQATLLGGTRSSRGSTRRRSPRFALPDPVVRRLLGRRVAMSPPTSLRPALLLSLGALLGACAPTEAGPELVTVDLISVNGLSAAAVEANAPALDALASGRLDGAETTLADTDDGRSLFGYLAGCALAPGQSAELPLPDGQSLVAAGRLGFAPAWREGPIGAVERRWVSACVIGHVNAFEIHVPLSVARRGGGRAGRDRGRTLRRAGGRVLRRPVRAGSGRPLHERLLRLRRGRRARQRRRHRRRRHPRLHALPGLRDLRRVPLQPDRPLLELGAADRGDRDQRVRRRRRQHLPRLPREADRGQPRPRPGPRPSPFISCGRTSTASSRSTRPRTSPARRRTTAGRPSPRTPAGRPSPRTPAGRPSPRTPARRPRRRTPASIRVTPAYPRSPTSTPAAPRAGMVVPRSMPSAPAAPRLSDDDTAADGGGHLAGDRARAGPPLRRRHLGARAAQRAAHAALLPARGERPRTAASRASRPPSSSRSAPPPGNDLVLSDQTVSRHHCAIIATADGFLVRDLHSTNGTLLERASDPVGLPEAARGDQGRADRASCSRAPRASCASRSPTRSASAAWSAPPPRSGACSRSCPRIAASSSTILIEGETGTGKGLLADAIPPRVSPAQRAVRGGRLRGDPVGAHRGRALRARARRPSPAPTRPGPARSRRRAAAPCSSTRSARCRSTCSPSSCARSRTAWSSGSARSTPVALDVRGGGGDQPRPPPRGQRRQLPLRPVLPAERGEAPPAAPARAPRGTSRS